MNSVGKKQRNNTVKLQLWNTEFTNLFGFWLCLMKMGVDSSLSQQLRMGTLLNNFPLIDHTNQVSILNAGQTMCDHNAGPTGTGKFQSGLNYL